MIHSIPFKVRACPVIITLSYFHYSEFRLFHNQAQAYQLNECIKSRSLDSLNIAS